MTVERKPKRVSATSSLSFFSDYLGSQRCLHVCAWLSQALKQGVLNVTGQTRLQEAFSLAQLAKHASAVAANRNLPELPAPAPAVSRTKTKIAAANANRIFQIPTNT